MNLVNYEVKNSNGEIFHTTRYSLATASGNRIIRVYLTPIDDCTPEQRARMREQMLHNKEILKAKKG